MYQKRQSVKGGGATDSTSYSNGALKGILKKKNQSEDSDIDSDTEWFNEERRLDSDQERENDGTMAKVPRPSNNVEIVVGDILTSHGYSSMQLCQCWRQGTGKSYISTVSRSRYLQKAYVAPTLQCAWDNWRKRKSLIAIRS